MGFAVFLIFLIIIIFKKINNAYKKTKKSSHNQYLKKLSMMISIIKIKNFIKSFKFTNIFLLVISLNVLIQTQTLLIHSYTVFGKFDLYNFKLLRLKSRHIDFFCKSYETYYLFLESFYFIFSLIFFTIYCLFKKLIFKTDDTNILVSSAIYIIYTHDIIYKLIYFLNYDLNDKLLPFLGNQEGVLFDFIIRIFHIVLIGLKFFPLLACIKTKNAVLDLFCFIYSSLIWNLELGTRAFCDKKNLENGELISLCENLPIYICSSFLMVNYLFLFIKNLKLDHNQLKINKNCVLIKNQYFLEKNDSYLNNSSEFSSLYSISFIIIYNLTVLGLKMSNLIGNNLKYYINICFQISTKQTSELISNDLLSEIKITFLVTTLLIGIQLILSFRNFGNDLSKQNSQTIQIKFKRSEILSSSLHFPGYFISHVIYSYLIYLIGIFFSIILFKILHHVNLIVINWLARLLLPVILILIFKFFWLKYLEKLFISKLSLKYYYIYSYFNFFSDCVIGLISCFSRIWKIVLISLLMYPRLDKSLFQEKKFIIHLDKGHHSYLNFVCREYFINNFVLNGLAHNLIESLKNFRNEIDFLKKITKISNKKFNDKKMLQLRNILFLAILLKERNKI